MATAAEPSLGTGTWHLDPAGSRAEFRVRMLYGLMTAKGGFTRCRGSLDLAARPAIELTIEADSIDTGNARRDRHLGTADFFDTAEHPEIRFDADVATLGDGVLAVKGTLRVAGGEAPLDVAVAFRPDGDEFEFEAMAAVDQRELGMTWSPLGTVGAPTTLLVSGRLVAAGVGAPMNG